MWLKKIIRNYFGFSKTETNALIILLPLCLTLLIGYSFIRGDLFFDEELNENDLKLLSEMDSIISEIRKEEELLTLKTSEFVQLDSIPKFNPNHVTKAFLDSIGIPSNVSQNWSNYISKGGRMYGDSALFKIYGMTPELYSELRDKIIFDTQKKPSVQNDQKKVRADINLVDTTALKEIRGIGSKLANRIIKFRDKLGGFISMDQLFEVYGLDSSVVYKIKNLYFISEDFKPEYINLNTASKEDFYSHPYINYKLADLIISFRNQEIFNEVEDLYRLPIMDSLLFEKLSPYLKAQAN